jgi:hypothetical protein
MKPEETVVAIFLYQMKLWIELEQYCHLKIQFLRRKKLEFLEMREELIKVMYMSYKY